MRRTTYTRIGVLLILGSMLLMLLYPVAASGQSTAPSNTVHDPGVRGGRPDAGGPIAGLTTAERAFFDAGLDQFSEVEGVKPDGLGPRFNLDSCGGCHIQPAIGGTSPFDNPQIAVATLAGAHNTIPSFISANGPVREARFKSDGGVHDLFVISGRSDAPISCNIQQPDFVRAAASHDLIFRIPTPVFGAGLIETITDSTILLNQRANANAKNAAGISGHANRNGNDGTITRFGWKAQNKSLLIFSGEAYNVEMGVTNELFPQEREENPGCAKNGVPENHTNFDEPVNTDSQADTDAFAIFMRFSAPPSLRPDRTPGEPDRIDKGSLAFNRVGCALCHTPALTTGRSSSTALANQTANLYSDLLVHNMGEGLADGISQGNAAGNEFRTAPLWGLGQRIFFLHDGRTTDLVQAITTHASPGSEANSVVGRFNSLTAADEQNLLRFLRSL